MAASFQGYNIFPGMQVRGVVDPSLQQLVATFNLECLSALQSPVDADLEWAEIAGVTAGNFQGRVPLDFTNLDGFEPFGGTRDFKEVQVTALSVDVNQWNRALRWDLRLLKQGNAAELSQIFGTATQAQNLVNHARIMKARLAATVLMKGFTRAGFTGASGGITAQAQVYYGVNLPATGGALPGGGLPLFSNGTDTAQHYANPTDPNSRRFSNYYTGQGLFSAQNMANARIQMRLIPSPSMSAETLGLQVTDLIGPSHMEEPFRQVALQSLSLQASYQTAPQSGASATNTFGAATNIYAAGSTPWRYHIAPQLDNDPYIAAYKSANPTWTPQTLPHLWFAVSRKLPGIRPIEMVAPSKQFTPNIKIFGDGTELAMQTLKAHVIADLDAGAAAGLPHCIARYEQT